MIDPRIEELAGCWDLVKATVTLPDGSVLEPWGEQPVGRILVLASGEFSAHVAKAHRPRFAGELPTPEEKQSAYDDHVAYFGELLRTEADGRTLVSYVRGATNANWVGGEQVRYVEAVDTDSFTLRVPPIDVGGIQIVARLRWVRRSSARLTAT